MGTAAILGKIGMCKGFAGCDPLLGVEAQHPLEKILGVGFHLGDHVRHPPGPDGDKVVPENC